MFEDTKGVSRSRKSKDKQHAGNIKCTQGHTMIYETLHIKLKSENHKSQ